MIALLPGGRRLQASNQQSSGLDVAYDVVVLSENAKTAVEAFQVESVATKSAVAMGLVRTELVANNLAWTEGRTTGGGFWVTAVSAVTTTQILNADGVEVVITTTAVVWSPPPTSPSCATPSSTSRGAGRRSRGLFMLVAAAAAFGIF